MASLQAYQSHGRRYYRIVESFRENGRPRIRVMAHLGRVEDILRVHQQERTAITVSSVSAGAVTALYHLANELDVAGRIDRSLKRTRHRPQKRAGLSVGQTLVAGMIGRACAPRSKRAFAHWAESHRAPRVDGLFRSPAHQPTLLGQMRRTDRTAGRHRAGVGARGRGQKTYALSQQVYETPARELPMERCLF